MRWLFDDAQFLKDNGRQKGCILLLLCLVDAFAKRQFPDEGDNRKRYCDYLDLKFPKMGLGARYRIEEKDKLVSLSNIIYEYFRCYFVHEGDSRDKKEYEVQIEYGGPSRFRLSDSILIDRSSNQFLVKGDWLINILIEVARTEFNEVSL